jgi:hypothetical protein
MTTPALESTVPVVAPTPEETRALTNAATDEEVLALAKQIQQAASLGFDPTTLVKGIVTAVDFAGTPPTVSLNISGDTTTAISSVRILNTYSPVVGDTVLIAKQASDIVILGQIANLGGKTVTNGANGWVKATLFAGSHNADSQGDVYYRRILDNGSWKMQWQGAWGVSGTIMVSGLTTDYRPKAKRVLDAARTLTGLPVCQLAFHTDGRVELLGGTSTAGNSGTVSGEVSYVDPADVTDFIDLGHAHVDWEGIATSFTGLGHSHGVFGGHDHTFSGGSHTHPVTAPTWVSLHGVEYFL